MITRLPHTAETMIRRWRPPQKREGAPGKVRQLRLSAARRDDASLREDVRRCKRLPTGKERGRDE